MNRPIFGSLPELLTYGILVLLLILNIAGLTISANNAQQAKILAAQNQKFATESQASTVIARKQNIERQNEIKGYIKCILLIRYDVPGLTAESPREVVAKALDDCAMANTKK